MRLILDEFYHATKLIQVLNLIYICGMWYFFVVVNDDLMFSLLLTLKGFQETSKVSKAALKLANVKEDTWTLNSIDFCIFWIQNKFNFIKKFITNMMHVYKK